MSETQTVRLHITIDIEEQGNDLFKVTVYHGNEVLIRDTDLSEEEAYSYMDGMNAYIASLPKETKVTSIVQNLDKPN